MNPAPVHAVAAHSAFPPSLWIGVLLIAIPFALLLLKALTREKYQLRQFLTNNEMEFFMRLSRALPGMFVFPQVAMSALIEPRAKEGTKQHLSDFGRISQKRVDYAVFNTEMELLCIIELDDKTHDPAKDKARDRLLESAGIKTVRWDSKRKPSAEEIRREVLQLDEKKPETNLPNFWAERKSQMETTIQRSA